MFHIFHIFALLFHRWLPTKIQNHVRHYKYFLSPLFLFHSAVYPKQSIEIYDNDKYWIGTILCTVLNVWVGRKLSSNYSARLKVVVISRSVRLLPTWLWWHNLGIGFAVRTAALLLTMHYCAALWPAIWTKKGVIVEVTKTDFISSLASNWQVKLVGLSCFIPWSIGRSWQKIQYSTNTRMKKWIYWLLNFITIF